MTVIAVHSDDLKDVQLYLIDQNVNYYKLEKLFYSSDDYYQELSIMSSKHASYILLKYNAFIDERKYPLE